MDTNIEEEPLYQSMGPFRGVCLMTQRVADPIIKMNTGTRVAILTVLYNYVLSFCFFKFLYQLL